MARARGSHAAGMAELRQATADLGAQLAQIEETFAEVLPREARNISRRAIVAVAREVRPRRRDPGKGDRSPSSEFSYASPSAGRRAPRPG